MRSLVFISILLVIPFCGFGQETIFTGLKSNEKRGDDYFIKGKYEKAYELYIQANNKNKGSSQLSLKIAKTSYELKNYSECVQWFEHYQNEGQILNQQERLLFAESLQRISKYDLAIDQYKTYLESEPDNKRVMDRIWRLSNINYLLEDSIFFNIKDLEINTTKSEYGAVFFDKGIVYTSDRNNTGLVMSVDGHNGDSYKTLYFTPDLITQENFSKGLNSKYNIGHPSFYKNESYVIYVKNGKWDPKNGSTLGLYFASFEDGTWKNTSEFAYNSREYSISHPEISEDGTTLFFTSDMPGGFGEKDIYVSYQKNGKWTKPENMGNKINSPGNDIYPFRKDDFLYFASDGHSGFGGLDIFKVNLAQTGNIDVVNLGYPINTSFDDFGIILDEEGKKGYISSNRKNGGFDDDIYEIEIDLQSYPLDISGVVKYKELEWRDTEKYKILANAKLYLIDVQRGLQVGETESDLNGNFTVEIPYASQYSIKVVEDNIGEIIVSFEIPKNKKKGEKHDIFLVKNGNTYQRNNEEWKE